MKTDHNPIIFRFLYFCMYFADALFTPFLALYFVSVDMDDVHKGILLGLIPFGAILGSFLFPRLASTYSKHLFLLRLIAIAETAGVFFFGFFGNFWILVFLIAVVSINNSSFFQMEDGACAICLKRNGVSFSSVRICGSLGYSIALLLGFFLVGRISYSFLFMLSSGFSLLGFLLSFLLHPYPDQSFSRKKEIGRPNVFETKAFLFYLLFYVFLFGSANIMGYVLPLYLKRLGLADNVYSLFNGLRVLCEIVTLLSFKWLRRFFKSDQNCLVASGTLLLLSSIPVDMLENPYVLLALHYFLRGFGGGLLIAASVAFLHRLLSDEGVTRGIGFVMGATNLFTGVGNIVAPYFYVGLSFPWLFIGLTLFQVLGLLFMAFSKKEVDCRDKNIGTLAAN